MKRLLLALLCLFSFSVYANEPTSTQEEATDKEAFSPGEMILHHIGDAHEWHFATLGDEEHGTHLTLPLPVIAFRPGKGLSVFSSSQLAEGKTYDGLKLEHEHLVSEDGSKVYDFSITKNVASLMLSAALLLLVFTSVARGYAKRGSGAPKGIQSFFEPIIVFVRDEVAKKSIGPKYERYMPYLLTVFFFIWFNNLLGLVPGGANLTGNIAVTLTLAVLTLLITLFSSNKNYWHHIFATPGVPKALLPIMIPVEIIGIFVKPFSLMVRLFANITAGHIVILSFISLIFIFRNIGVAPVTLAFGLFINMLELLVAILQAYIFTLLTAMYIGGAVEEHHDADYQMGGGNGADEAHAHAH
ncbi:F-type H+-transporting ATPase subunit a [Hymenobacter luteus]|uniref:ATP synthase subunit a n=2 Tax=Hymenobacter TaxID=89966 RepID=A0A7W9WD80_9BACT|nr:MULTISPECIES: F0F1 ATP synthase subunit A [Hymenobacter]MBB4602384.1 F-type H+-transporting ATPase subunit a [Hymenobacter latericoloratus]MBB6060275.1 F-type H+-transporting ATPase subunit a [Hymenobacter luteus]